MADGLTMIANNVANVLEEEIKLRKKCVKKLGMQGERNAKVEITKVVYDTPQTENYRRTGNLRNSLTHEDHDDYTLIGTNVEYAKFVEFGTSKMKQRPYLRPTIENHMDEYKQIIKDTLEGK